MNIKNMEIGFLSGFFGTLIIGFFSLVKFSGLNINGLLIFILYGLLVGAFGLLNSIYFDDFKIQHAMIVGFVGVAMINAYSIITSYSSNYFPIILGGIEGTIFVSIAYIILCDWVIKRRK